MITIEDMRGRCREDGKIRSTNMWAVREDGRRVGMIYQSNPTCLFITEPLQPNHIATVVTAVRRAHSEKIETVRTLPAAPQRVRAMDEDFE